MAAPEAPPTGAQRPRILTSPARHSSAGRDAVDLAAYAGLKLDPWQQFVLEESLGERADGLWAASEVGLVVSRQNGKGSILEARELAGLFLFKERLIVHSAHEFKTAADAYRRIKGLIRATPSLHKRVLHYNNAHGNEGIELKTGQQLRFFARTKGSGRGFTADTLVLDEAYELSDAALSALLPTTSAVPNPQLWYTSSAVNAEEHSNGLVLARVRARGLRGDDALAYLEWSAEDGADSADLHAWAQANPGLGIRLNPRSIGRDLRAMSRKTFRVEHLGIGDWPQEDTEDRVVADTTWAALKDLDGGDGALRPVAVAVDITPDRSRASVGLAGRREDGRAQLEVLDSRPGTGWLIERLLGLIGRHDPVAVVLDGNGPALSLVPAMTAAGIEPMVTSAKEMAQAFGGFYDDAHQDRLRHLDDEVLNQALRIAKTRDLAGGKAWTRHGAGDITPVVSVTLARLGLELRGSRKPPPSPEVVRAGGSSATGELTSIGF